VNNEQLKEAIRNAPDQHELMEECQECGGEMLPNTYGVCQYCLEDSKADELCDKCGEKLLSDGDCPDCMGGSNEDDLPTLVEPKSDTLQAQREEMHNTTGHCVSTGIPCIECQQSKVLTTDNVNGWCDNCGTEYTIISPNTVRYKK
jgi:hypothetical protein